MVSSTIHLINLISFILNTFIQSSMHLLFVTHPNGIILISYSIELLGCSLPTANNLHTSAPYSCIANDIIYYTRHCCPHNSISSVMCSTSILFLVSTFRRQVLVGQAPCALYCVHSQHFHADMYFTVYSCMLMNANYDNSRHTIHVCHLYTADNCICQYSQKVWFI